MGCCCCCLFIYMSENLIVHSTEVNKLSKNMIHYSVVWEDSQYTIMGSNDFGLKYMQRQYRNLWQDTSVSKMTRGSCGKDVKVIRDLEDTKEERK